MIRTIPFDTLGRFRNEWLNSRFHFHFSGVAAPMGHAFGPLRVWNDDEIRAGTGFDLHGHRDMEIITYVRRGAISHKDSLGNEGRTAAGDVQVMSAGTGIRHAEFNRESEDTELYQIWVEPNQLRLPPRWETASFPKADRAGQLVPLASGQASVSGALPIAQDATLYGAMLPENGSLTHRPGPGRRVYLVAASGHIEVNGTPLGERDGAAIEGEEALTIRSGTGADLLLFDLP